MTGGQLTPGLCPCASPNCADRAAKQRATDPTRRPDGLCPCTSPSCSDRALKDQADEAVQP